MSEPELDTEEARQAESGKGVRIVLVVSTIAAVIAIAIAFGIFV